MRRFMMANAIVCMSVLFVACSSSSSGSKPASQAGQPASGPAWSLTLKSACVKAGEDQCVAKHGFTVSADGKFQVGPGPKGQVIQGSLADADFSALKARVETAISAAQLGASAAEKTEAGVPNEDNDILTLSRNGQENVLARNTASDFSYVTASFEEALGLHNAIRDLAKSYYRLPFGNDCADAAAAVEALYPAMQECQADIDCVYVNNVGTIAEIAPNSHGQSIFKDECTAVRPITVSNRAALQSGAQGILDAYNKAVEACGDGFYRSNLGARDNCQHEWLSTAKAPSCVRNRCQANE